MGSRKLQTHIAPSGYKLPSIHAFPPFFCFQPAAKTRVSQDDQWVQLILSYARFRRLFTLTVDDAEKTGSDWEEVLINERINRRLTKQQVRTLLQMLVARGQATYEPPRQDDSVLLYWRKPGEWAEVLHSWAVSTGQLNTIMTFYEIQAPSLPSELSDIPTPLLKRAIDILTKTNRAQIIESGEGDGVRFFAGSDRKSVV